MKKAWPFLAVIVVIVVIAAVAVGKKNNNNSTSPSPAPTSSQSSTEPSNAMNPNSMPPSSSQPQSTNSVSIVNMSFTPASITVKKGTTVTWTNNDSIAHTVTADSGSSFDSGNLNPGKNFSHTFDSVGTFAYHCTYHSDMHGTVTVTE